MILITLYALFGDDFRLCLLPKSVDDAFFGCTCFALFFFMNEILLYSVAYPKYFNSFYFWLDLVATISLIFDIGWLWD